MTNEKWEELKRNYYQSNMVVITEGGAIDFSVDGYHETELNGAKVSYDEYLDIQCFSGAERLWFAKCYYDSISGADCKGQIERLNASKGMILFKRIFVSGMYGDGAFFDGKEDHVWISREGFEQYKVGDCLSFNAEVYRYLKTGNGKTLDFGIRSPEDIKMIDSYELPSDDDLIRQELGDIVCDTCLFSEQCYGNMCIATSGWREERMQQLFDTIKQESKVMEE